MGVERILTHDVFLRRCSRMGNFFHLWGLNSSIGDNLFFLGHKYVPIPFFPRWVRILLFRVSKPCLLSLLFFGCGPPHFSARTEPPPSFFLVLGFWGCARQFPPPTGTRAFIKLNPSFVCLFLYDDWLDLTPLVCSWPVCACCAPPPSPFSSLFQLFPNHMLIFNIV